jgi:probable blue pigment (indigoidine) exporter
VRVGVLYAASAGVLFGSSYVATALALRSFGPLAVTAWRGLLGTLGLSIILFCGAVPAPRVAVTRANLGRLAVLGVLGGPGIIIGTNTAVVLVGATVTSFVAGLYAILAVLLAVPVLGERLQASAVVGLVAALAGTVLLGDVRLGDASTPGIAAALVGASSYALFLVLSRRWSRSGDLGGPVVALSTVAAAGFGVLALAAVLDPSTMVPRSIDAVAVGGLVWVAVAATCGQVLVVASLQRIDARRSSALLLLNPPTAAFLAWLVLGQVLRPLEVLGAVIVLAGIAVGGGLFRLRVRN